jgi:hypothetical protein
MKLLRKTGLLAPALLWCALFNSPLASASLVDALAVEAPAVDISTLSGGFHLAVMAQPTALALEDFMASTAGTVTLTTRAYAWGDLLSVLSTNVFITGVPTLALTGPGTVVFGVGAGQLFSSSLRLAAAGPRGYGMAGLDISFVPQVTQVPLPAGVWLLAGGLGLLVSGARRKSGRRTAIAA